MGRALLADAGEARRVAFRIERRGPEFLARRISGGAIFPGESGRDEVSEQALAATFDKGGAEPVTRLYRRGDSWEDQCWLARRAGGVWVTDRVQRADCRRRVALAPGDESGTLDLKKLSSNRGDRSKLYEAVGHVRAGRRARPTPLRFVKLTPLRYPAHLARVVRTLGFTVRSQNRGPKRGIA
jgi:hypothetical protein